MTAMAPTYPLTWPTQLLPPATPRIALQAQSKSGGQSASGVEQVARSPAARWAVSLANIPIRTRAQTLAWRAIEGALDGRAGTILVPIYDWLRAPGGKQATVPFDDAAVFDDGAAFQGSASNVALQQDAGLNSTQIVVAWAGAAPQPGQHFSIGSQGLTELHRIIGFDQSGDGVATLTVRPWMRAAWPAGTRLEFDEPLCLCRLATDDTMKLDLDLWRFASPSVDFVEAF